MPSMIDEALLHAPRITQDYAWGRVVWHVWGESATSVDASPSAKRLPLVLLHGGSGSWTHWVRNVVHLSRHRTVWALDIPGFGDSDLPPAVMDADDLAPYLAEIFAHTFGDCAVDVMGFSFGGMTAGLLAAAHPECVRQLFLVGVPGLGLLPPELPLKGMRVGMSAQAQREVHRHNLAAMMLADAGAVTEALIDMQLHNVARDRLRRRRLARTDILLKVQSRWQCPVHGIWGACDALYRQTLSQVPQLLPGLASFAVVPRAGHWVMYECPDEFHAALAPLLAH